MRLETWTRWIPHHRLRNSFSANIQELSCWEDLNPIQTNSENSQHFFIVDCITQSTIWKVLPNNTWKRRKSNFQNQKILKRNSLFLISTRLLFILSLLMIRLMSNSHIKVMSSSSMSDLIVWNSCKPWAKFSTFMSLQLELKIMLSQSLTIWTKKRKQFWEFYTEKIACKHTMDSSLKIWESLQTNN